MSRRKSKKGAKRKADPKRDYVDINLGEVKAILARAPESPMSQDDHEKLKLMFEAFVETLALLQTKRRIGSPRQVFCLP